MLCVVIAINVTNLFLLLWSDDIFRLFKLNVPSFDIYYFASLCSMHFLHTPGILTNNPIWHEYMSRHRELLIVFRAKYFCPIRHELKSWVWLWIIIEPFANYRRGFEITLFVRRAKDPLVLLPTKTAYDVGWNRRHCLETYNWLCAE